ncbi:MAG: ribosome-associated translation inhibitor RaiA [Arenicellales bacterium]
MQISISGQHLDITEALRAHVKERMDKIIQHFDHVTNAQVVLHIEKETNFAEANIHTKGASIHATGDAENMYAAIDLMSAKLDRQVLKHKAKLTDHHRSDGGLKHAMG